MNDSILSDLYSVVCDRKANPAEGSYTAYLLDKGLDKILKKCGEECAETIIAAKNADNAELAGEIADLLYHLVVLMVERGLSVGEVEAVLKDRSLIAGNLKSFHKTDKNS